jgi:hypothetical protein
MMSLSDARLGELASADGIAARNEWPEKFFADSPIWRSNSDTTVEVKTLGLRFLPLANWKTGRSFLISSGLLTANDFREEQGQNVLFFISKRSTKSPEIFRITLGKRMFITTDPMSVNLIWLHVRFSMLFSDLGRISPSLKEPKKTMQHAAQKTSLLSFDQLLNAISWPMIFNNGKDMTNLDFLVMLV